MSQNPPIGLMLVPMPLIAGLVAGIVIGLASGSWLWAIVSLVVIAMVAAAAAYFFAEALALRLLKARPLAETGSLALRNQLEELCARTGVVEPDLYTVGAGAPAIASVGRNGSALVVSDGLVDDLTVVELEAAVARELARTQSGATIVDTLAVPFVTLPFGMFGSLADRALQFFRGADHDARIDLDGISITRYPPGMTAALSKMTEDIPKAASRAVSHLWAVGQRPKAMNAGAFGIEERLELLHEL